MKYNLDSARKNIESIIFALEDCAYQTESFGRISDELGEKIDRLLFKIKGPDDRDWETD